MEGSYEVYFGRQPAGKVTVRRLGLYYKFECRCKLTGGVVYRLQVVCGDRQENLGILVPAGNGFGLDTKVPVKRLGEGKPEFRLVPKHEKSSGVFYPVYPEEPFAHIGRLKNAYLARKNGVSGIMIE